MRELADTFDSLSAKERALLKASMDDVIRETPRATVAAQRVRALVRKAGRQARPQLQAALTEVLSPAALKDMGLAPRTRRRSPDQVTGGGD
jgi:hypothetical protein